ncbi:hypothetical protein B0H13DRAFT_2277742 [Mycena leptocephala]|nr:hypothetical protein B0H13DRAFT_2277742 [Mycena leptocephala]
MTGTVMLVDVYRVIGGAKRPQSAAIHLQIKLTVSVSDAREDLGAEGHTPWNGYHVAEVRPDTFGQIDGESKVLSQIVAIWAQARYGGTRFGDLPNSVSMSDVIDASNRKLIAVPKARIGNLLFWDIFKEFPVSHDRKEVAKIFYIWRAGFEGSFWGSIQSAGI